MKVSELRWIDPATGKPHVRDHICNQQCRDLKEQAREDMKKMDVQKALKALRDPTRLIMESRESVIVYKDDLDAVLDRLEELERKTAGTVDLDSELKVGDTVVSLIGYLEMRPGTQGKVVAIKPQAAYPIEVQFAGIKFLYLKDGLIGFNRNELGKVAE